MIGRAQGREAEAELLGLGADCRKRLRNGFSVYRGRICKNEQRGLAIAGNRLEVVHWVIRHRAQHVARQDVNVGRCQQGVAIRRRLPHRLAPDGAVGPAAVLDHNRRTEPLLKQLGCEASHDVGRSACGIRHHDADRPVRPTLCRSRCSGDERQQKDDRPQVSFSPLAGTAT